MSTVRSAEAALEAEVAFAPLLVDEEAYNLVWHSKFKYVLALMALLLLAIALATGAVSIYIFVQDHPSTNRSPCSDYCDRSHPPDAYCYGVTRNSQGVIYIARHDAEFVCQTVGDSHSATCYEYDSAGCIENWRYDVPDVCSLRDMNDSLPADSDARCAPTSFSTFAVRKYLYGDSSVAQLPATTFLTQSSQDYVNIDLGVLVRNRYPEFVAKFYQQNELIDQFFTDYQSELSDSIRYYLSFMWHENPIFRSVLPPGSPLLEPSDLNHTPEREAWRNWAITYTLRNGITPVGRNPMFYFLGGGTASGKTTLVRSLVAQGILTLNNSVYINADDFKVIDPLYQFLVQLGEYQAAEVVHADSAVLANTTLYRAIDNRFNIVYDATMSNLNRATSLINYLNEVGYDLMLIGITTAADVAVVRSSTRTIVTGRWVPAPITLDSHRSFSVNFPTYAQLIPRVQLYESPESASPRLIGSCNGAGSQFVVQPGQELAYEVFLNKSMINTRADNIYQVYDPPQLSFSMLTGGCVSYPTSYDAYSRVFLDLILANARRKSSFENLVGNLYVCLPHPPTPAPQKKVETMAQTASSTSTTPRDASARSADEQFDAIQNAMHNLDVWNSVVNLQEDMPMAEFEKHWQSR